jgi:hypothetical protein
MWGEGFGVVFDAKIILWRAMKNRTVVSRFAKEVLLMALSPFLQKP